jgi:hypothetical protein
VGQRPGNTDARKRKEIADMTRLSRTRRAWLLAAATASAALACAVALAAVALAASKPHVVTGGVGDIRGASGLLEGTVKPEEFEVSYFFDYWLEPNQIFETKPVTIAKGDVPVKVGQTVAGLVPGEHYELVGTYVDDGVARQVTGGEKVYKGSKADRQRFVVPTGKENEVSVHYGEAAYLTGSLAGSDYAEQTLTLESTPYPYSSAFVALPGTVLSGRTGSFTFKVPRMLESSEFRVVTDAPRPLYSPTIRVSVSPRISLHVQKLHGAGRYRLYGTLAPLLKGADVVIQQLLPQKPGSKRSGPAPHVVGNAIPKRAASTYMRFSVVLTLSGTYHYRAYVKMARGPLISGHSDDVLIKAPKASGKASGKRRKRG